MKQWGVTYWVESGETAEARYYTGDGSAFPEHVTIRVGNNDLEGEIVLPRDLAEKLRDELIKELFIGAASRPSGWTRVDS